MNAQDKGRVVVSLQPILQTEASIDAAIRLAAALQTEAVGMFIHDDSLLSLAELPLSGGLDHFGKPVKPPTPNSMLRAFKRLEEHWQKLLVAEAAKARVDCSFVSQSGNFLSVIESALAHGDYLVVSTSGSDFDARKLHDQLAALPTGISGIIVVTRTSASRGKAPVVALLDGDAQTKRILGLAVRLARLTGTSLEILAHTGNTDEIKQKIAEVQLHVSPRLNVNYRSFTTDSIEHTIKMLHNIEPGFVVAASNNELLMHAPSVALICRAARAPMVILRDDKSQ